MIPTTQGVRARNEALLAEYLDWQRDVRGRKASSVYDYSSKLSAFVNYVGDMPLAHVSVDMMEEWVGRTRRGRRKPMPRIGAQGQPLKEGFNTRVGSPATRAKEVTLLRTFYRYLHARGYVDTDPTILLHGPKVTNDNPKPIDPDTWASVWGSPHLPDEARVVLGLGFFVGLRRAEIASLTPKQVGTQTRRLVGFKRKGGGDDVTPYGDMVDLFHESHPHLLPDPKRFLTPLTALQRARSDRPRLLPWREESGVSPFNRRKHALGESDIDPEQVNRKVARWLRLVGQDEAFSPHQLRHSCATYLVQAGVPIHIVRSLMNHHDISTTMRYVKVGRSALADWRRTQEPFTVDRYQRHEVGE